MQRPHEYLTEAYVNGLSITSTLSALVFAYWFYNYVQRRRQYQVGCVEGHVDGMI